MVSLENARIQMVRLLAGLLFITAVSVPGNALARDLRKRSEHKTHYLVAGRRSEEAYPVSLWQKPRDRTGRSEKPRLLRSSCRLSPAQQYAGEVLSYLLQVALGQEGDPGSREEWRTIGLDASLELENFYHVVTDSEEDVQELVVLDPNTLDISRVLYYYDRRLSSTKGRLGVLGLYPAPEFIAIRLLLLRKIHRGEKIRLKALVEREELLFNKALGPSAKDYEATNLRADEMDLIRDIIAREPYLYDYLTSPFLVKALLKVGAVEKDDFVEKKIAQARYKGYGCRHFGGSKGANAAKIAFLPSIIETFEYGESQTHPSRFGFEATPLFHEMINKLKDQILDQTGVHLNRKINEGKSPKDKVIGKEWETLLERIARENIAFYVQDERPLVIYPANAREVIQDVCPEADFVVILLGKNVYLALYINRQQDVYPSVPWIYMDVYDIKYSQNEEECEQIAEVIYSKIKDDMDEIIKEAF